VESEKSTTTEADNRMVVTTDSGGKGIGDVGKRREDFSKEE
jgi:hypothetical protein